MEFVYSSGNPETPAAFVSFEAMHTIYEMVVVGACEFKARKLAEDVENIVSRIEKILDRHDVNSEFYKINESAGHGWTVVDEETFGILQFCEIFRRSTMGYFDISALSGIRVSPSYRLEPGSCSVALAEDSVVLDAGGFGKGYALDHVKKYLDGAGVRNALLNFGDSSVVAMGQHPFGDCWQVGALSGGHQFRLRNKALSVSGRRSDGKEHIMDPVQQRFVAGGASVAVEGPSAFVCEILSTALYAAPAEMRPGIIRGFEGYDYVELRQDMTSWIEGNL